MTKTWAWTLATICVALAALNLALLAKVQELSRVNTTLAQKVTPSLREQFDLFERSLIGRSLAGPMAELDPGAAMPEAPTGGGGHRLVLYFPGESCRRSLNQEMRLLDEHRTRLARLNLDPVIFLASFEPPDFETLVRQYGVEDHAHLDQDQILREALGISPAGLLLLLSPRDVILNARVSTGLDEELGQAFYRQVDGMLSGVPS